MSGSKIEVIDLGFNLADLSHLPPTKTAYQMAQELLDGSEARRKDTLEMITEMVKSDIIAADNASAYLQTVIPRHIKPRLEAIAKVGRDVRFEAALLCSAIVEMGESL